MKKQEKQRVRSRSNSVIFFSCILGLVAAVLIGLLINNATAGARFEREITAINNAFLNGNTQKIDEILERTVSTGGYAKVETSLKKYVSDLVKNINGIKEVTDNEAVYDSLEGEYLAKNAKKLDGTIATLTDASKRVDALAKDAQKLYDEDSVKAYIDNQGLEESYTNLFIENAKQFYGDKDLHDDYSNTLSLLRSSIKVEIEAVEFLKNHDSDWEVVNGSLKFKNENTSRQYTRILEKVADS